MPRRYGVAISRNTNHCNSNRYNNPHVFSKSSSFPSILCTIFKLFTYSRKIYLKQFNLGAVPLNFEVQTNLFPRRISVFWSVLIFSSCTPKSILVRDISNLGIIQYKQDKHTGSLTIIGQLIMVHIIESGPQYWKGWQFCQWNSFLLALISSK